MIDWSFPPDIQAQYDRVVANTRRLQIELGIKPMTIEERHQEYLKRQQEIEAFKKVLATRRPPPKWKV